jgi:hypothetical protein
MKSTPVHGLIWGIIPIAITLTLLVLKVIAPSLARSPSPEALANVKELFLPEMQRELQPEPLEQLRYIMGICLYPILLFLGLLAGKKWPSRLGRFPPAILLSIGFIFFAWNWIYQARSESAFAVPSAASLVLSAVAGFAIYIFRQRSMKVPSAYPVVAWGLAAAYLVIRLSPSLVTEGNVSKVPRSVWHHLPFTLNEFSAVLNGRTLWVDFFPQYSNLLPYLFAPLFELWGMSVTHFTWVLLAMSAICFGIVFWLFYRLFESHWTALAAFVPFTALCLIALPKEVGEVSSEVVNVFNYYQIGPLRYFLPFLSLFALGRYLSTPSRFRLAVLGLVAGAAAINNFDFGIPALVGCATAIVLSRSFASNWVRTGALFLSAAFVPLLIFVLVTFLRSGHTPYFSQMFSYQRVFALFGFYMLPMDRYGNHWNVLVTFLICLSLAIHSFLSRSQQSPKERFLVGMLAFVAVFGCGVFAYFVGRSHANVLVSTFMVWGIAWILLIRYFIDHRKALSGFSQALTTAFLVIGICPWLLEIPNWVPLKHQVQRLRFADAFKPEQTAEKVLSRIAQTGATSLIFLYPYGHHFSNRANLANLSPLAQRNSILLWSQWEKLEHVARAKKVHWIAGEFSNAMKERLQAMGYTLRFSEGDADAWSL